MVRPTGLAKGSFWLLRNFAVSDGYVSTVAANHFFTMAVFLCASNVFSLIFRTAPNSKFYRRSAMEIKKDPKFVNRRFQMEITIRIITFKRSPIDILYIHVKDKWKKDAKCKNTSFAPIFLCDFLCFKPFFLWCLYLRQDPDSRLHHLGLLKKWETDVLRGF